MKNRQPLIIISVICVVVFLLLQSLVTHAGSYGPWCLPALGTPNPVGHPEYDYMAYGFPIPWIERLTNTCAEPHSTSYEWIPIGLVVDGLILLVLISPLWMNMLKKRSTEQTTKAV